MKVRAAVVEPLPLYRLGVAACLADLGVVVDNPGDIRTWQPGPGAAVVVLSMCSTEAWRLLGELQTSRPDLLIIALLDSRDVGIYARALRSGAISVLARTSSPNNLKRCVEALAEGTATLPIEVVRALAADPDDADDAWATGRPSDEELSWLRHLAEGGTVSELAANAGYSERMMYRLLRRLYGKLTTGTRTEALMAARDRGWI